MKERYLAILNLTNTATKSEIKKAFRLLALQYHPDKNSSEGAKQKFIEINQAYDFLMSDRANVITKPFAQYKHGNTVKDSVSEAEKETKKKHDFYRKRVLEKKGKSKFTYASIKDTFLVKFSKTVGAFSILLSLFLLLNYFILDKKDVEVYLTNYEVIGSTEISCDFTEISSSHTYHLTIPSSGSPAHFKKLLNEKTPVVLNKTPIFNDVVCVTTPFYSKSISYDNVYTISSSYWIMFFIFIPFIIVLFLEGPNYIYMTTIDSFTIFSILSIIAFVLFGFYNHFFF